MAIALRFLPPIPEGMYVPFPDEEVAGIQFRIPAARAFAGGSDHALRLEREPGNRHDPNAIKVIAVSKGWFFRQARHIGYVAAEVARMIAKRGDFEQLEPRLKNIWWGGYVRDYIVVRFDIMAPDPPREIRPTKRGRPRMSDG